MNYMKKAIQLSQLCAVSSRSLRGENLPIHALGIIKPRIIGGSEANEGRYSYAVSMQDRIGHFCGGSLIASDVVLSAAHCRGGKYKAVIGRHDLRTNDGDEVDVATELPHPDYNPSSSDNDLMLLFLSRPTTEYVDFVKISPDETPVGASVTVMGWGDTNISDNISELADELMEVEVKTISNNACEASSGKIGGWDETYKGQITKNMMCAEENGRAEDACQGDSGGSLVMHTNSGDYQVGVVSWGVGCGHNAFPGVYARVSAQYNWIRDEVCKRSSAPPSYLKCDNAVDGDNVEFGGGAAPSSGASNAGAGNTNAQGNNAQVADAVSHPGASNVGDDVDIDDVNVAVAVSSSDNVTDNGVQEDNLEVTEVVSHPDTSNVGVENDTFAAHVNNAEVADAVSYSDTSINFDNVTWCSIMSEDFEKGMSNITSSGRTKWYPSAKYRDGVVRIQENASFTSKELLVENYTKFKVKYSFLTLQMEPDDEFYFGYSINNTSNWTELECWNSTDNLHNKVWYDESVIFEAPNVDSVQIRFSCEDHTKHEDVLFDAIEVLAAA